MKVDGYDFLRNRKNVRDELSSGPVKRKASQIEWNLISVPSKDERHLVGEEIKESNSDNGIYLHPNSNEHGEIFPGYYMIPSTSHNGCIELRDSNTNAGNLIILGNCAKNSNFLKNAVGDTSSSNLSLIWRVDEDGLFHSGLDDNMCIQSGFRSGRGIGTGDSDSTVRMRIEPCDANNEYQQFLWHEQNSSISPSNRKDLCVVFRGTHADVEDDPIILKSCDHAKNRVDWTGEIIHHLDPEEGEN